MRRKLAILIILSIMASTVTANTSETDTTKINTTLSDSTLVSLKYKSSFVEHPPDTSRTQNPTAALFKSLFIPGWGQIGNKKYIKAVIFAGLESAAFATYWHYRKKAEDARSAFESADELSQGQLFREYEDIRLERNRFAWYTGTMIFISMFDAYVDAHLVNFPKRNESITLDLMNRDASTPGLMLSYRF